MYIYVYICDSHSKITYVFTIPDLYRHHHPNQETTVPRPESSKIALPHVGYASPSRVVHRCPPVRRRPWSSNVKLEAKRRLPEPTANILAPENGWLEYDRFLLGRQVRPVSFGRLWNLFKKTHSYEFSWNKSATWLFLVVYLGDKMKSYPVMWGLLWKPVIICGDYFINDEMMILIEQRGCPWKVRPSFFFPWLT